MKVHHHSVLAVTLIIFLSFQFGAIMGIDLMLDMQHTENVFLTADLVVHPEIVIGSDDDFQTQSWPGNGSVSDPYRIDSLHITSTSDCITIENTTAYFTITDCLLDGYSSSYDYGVVLNNVTNGDITKSAITEKNSAVRVFDIQNCNFTYLSATGCGSGIYIGDGSGDCIVAHNDISIDDFHGVRVSDSHDVSIINNTIGGGRQFGVYLDTSPDCYVSNNTITDIQWYGIRIYKSDNAVIRNNTVDMGPPSYYEYQYGIHAHDSFGLEFVNNTILGDSDVSLQLEYVSNALVENNTFDNGVLITSGTFSRVSHDMSNNNVQGKPLYYIEGLTDTIIDGSLYGQIILVDAVNVSVNGGSFENVSAAVTISRSENCSIDSVSATGCDIYGILVQFCERVEMNGLTISDSNGMGLHIRKSTYSEVYGCTVTDLHSRLNINSGIVLGDDCEHSLVSGNEVHRVEFIGIQVYASDNVTLLDNVVTDTEKESLILMGSSNCTIAGNNFQHGISIEEIWNSDEWKHNITGNYIASKSIGYFRDTDDITINGPDYGQVYLVNCSNVDLQNLETANVIKGLVIIDCTNITAQYITMSSYWAWQRYSSYDMYHVIDLRDSTHCEISDVVIDHATSGIRSLYCTNITLQDISITYTGFALHLLGGQNYTILECDLNHNSQAIRCQGIANSSIIQNSILSNEVGILLYTSHDNTIFGNEIGWNSEYNAYDELGSNTWDNGVDTGNAWSDYSLTGTYPIPGTSGSIDRYPTVLEDLPPTTTTGTGTVTPTSPTTSPWTGPLDDLPVVYIALAVGGIGVVLIIIIIFVRRK